MEVKQQRKERPIVTKADVMDKKFTDFIDRCMEIRATNSGMQ